jgi:hypothetical protein
MSKISSNSVNNSASIFAVKEKVFSVIMFVLAILLFIAWPFTHIFIPQVYMPFVGFIPGSYAISMVNVSGTCGLLPVFLLVYLGISPKNKWGLISILSLFFVLLVAMFLYLIISGAFPKGLYPGVFMDFLLAAILPILYANLIEKLKPKL